MFPRRSPRVPSRETVLSCPEKTNLAMKGFQLWERCLRITRTPVNTRLSIARSITTMTTARTGGVSCRSTAPGEQEASRAAKSVSGLAKPRVPET
jgi:hypothetical protein